MYLGSLLKSCPIYKLWHADTQVCFWNFVSLTKFQYAHAYLRKTTLLITITEAGSRSAVGRAPDS